MGDSTWAATWHPRPCPPWVCRFCSKRSPVDSLNAEHEDRCTQRLEDQ